MCLYVRRTVKPGGKTARMISPAKLTGTRDGTGAQVGPTLGKAKQICMFALAFLL